MSLAIRDAAYGMVSPYFDVTLDFELYREINEQENVKESLEFIKQNQGDHSKTKEIREKVVELYLNEIKRIPYFNIKFTYSGGQHQFVQRCMKNFVLHLIARMPGIVFESPKQMDSNTLTYRVESRWAPPRRMYKAQNEHPVQKSDLKTVISRYIEYYDADTIELNIIDFVKKAFKPEQSNVLETTDYTPIPRNGYTIMKKRRFEFKIECAKLFT